MDFSSAINNGCQKSGGGRGATAAAALEPNVRAVITEERSERAGLAGLLFELQGQKSGFYPGMSVIWPEELLLLLLLLLPLPHYVEWSRAFLASGRRGIKKLALHTSTTCDFEFFALFERKVKLF